MLNQVSISKVYFQKGGAQVTQHFLLAVLFINVMEILNASHRDRALQTLQTIVTSLTVALGEEGSVTRKELVGLYDKQTKAGEFVAADGTVRQAGIVEGEGTDFKI